MHSNASNLSVAVSDFIMEFSEQIIDNCHTFELPVVWILKYEACPESKDTSRVGRWGNFLCLLWQHCCRTWSFTCEPCSFDSRRTGVVWVRRVWNRSADPKVRPNARCFPSYDFSTQKVNVKRKFTNKLLLDLAPSDFHLLLHLKNISLGKTSTT